MPINLRVISQVYEAKGDAAKSNEFFSLTSEMIKRLDEISGPP
jgi:hypothetical protein